MITTDIHFTLSIVAADATIGREKLPMNFSSAAIAAILIWSYKPSVVLKNGALKWTGETKI